METRFDKLANGKPPSYEETLSFINSEIEKAREELLEEIEKKFEIEFQHYPFGIKSRLYFHNELKSLKQK